MMGNHRWATIITLRMWITILIALLLPLLASAADNGDSSVYWGFEKGQAGDPVASVPDDNLGVEAQAQGGAVAYIEDSFKVTDIDPNNPMLILPAVVRTNHRSVKLDGGYLQVKPFSTPSLSKNFTIELCAKFVASHPVEDEILMSGGPTDTGKWSILFQKDGAVQLVVPGGACPYFFDHATGGPKPGVWYHLAATFEECGDGRKKSVTYVNGNPEDSSAGSPGVSKSGMTELCIGAASNGANCFHGLIDEVRITGRLLTPSELLIEGPKSFPGMKKKGDAEGMGYYRLTRFPELPKPPDPLFVSKGTRIGERLRAKAAGAPILARPDGYTYFYTFAGAIGRWSDPGEPFVCPNVPAGCDPGFGTAARGWAVYTGGAPAGYHFSVRPGGKYTVAVGFFDPATPPDKRIQYVVIDGKRVDTVDPSEDGKGKPFVRKYECEDLNKDGYLEVTCCQVREEFSDYMGMLNVIWVFDASDTAAVDTDKLVHGQYDVPPLYYVKCGLDRGLKGHVGYPKLSEQARAKMLPGRPVPFDLDSGRPQLADPLDIDIKGELVERINTFLDRWGYAERDQWLISGYLFDSSYETGARYLMALAMLSRLMHNDYDLRGFFEELISKQDKTSKYPGSIVGGNPRRTAQIWTEGLIITALMAYHEVSGDPRALEAARKLGDWYQYYLDNGDLAATNYLADESKFSRVGGTVGHLGKGAPEGLMWLYWRTKDKKYLDIAKQMAELNRKWGSVAWMIHGDNWPNEHPEYEDFHILTALTTIRGFPWIYAATGDKSYLDDAIKACDRVFERSTWSTGQVQEQTSWGRDAPIFDEACQTSDLMQLCYLLAEFTGEGRFYDRAEHLYYDGIRYQQMHDGDFTGYDTLPGPQHGTSWWYCCTPYCARGLYEVARHLYASSQTAIYINGFMPSTVNLRLKQGSVKVETTADIPRSGRVHLKLNPKDAREFDVKIRVPGWATLKSVAINGRDEDVKPKDGYVTLGREWNANDTVDVRFDLPLRVVVSNSWDGAWPGKVSVDGAKPVDGRSISIFRGPAILTQFRPSHGCDMSWAYTGDHPDLPDSLTSAADVIDAGSWKFESNGVPTLTEIKRTSDGVRLDWEMAPHPGWTLRKTAVVHATIPVEVEYSSELIAPDAESAKSLKSARMCGVRMRTIGYTDYRKPKLLAGEKGRQIDFPKPEGTPLDSRKAVLDNGYIQFCVQSSQKLTGIDGGTYAGVYVLPVVEGNSLKASCKLKITGQNQFQAHIIRPVGK